MGHFTLKLGDFYEIFKISQVEVLREVPPLHPSLEWWQVPDMREPAMKLNDEGNELEVFAGLADCMKDEHRVDYVEHVLWLKEDDVTELEELFKSVDEKELPYWITHTYMIHELGANTLIVTVRFYQSESIWESVWQDMKTGPRGGDYYMGRTATMKEMDKNTDG